MEVIIYGIVISAVWVAAATVLLPFFLLLKYSKSFRDKWFSLIFMTLLETHFEAMMIPIRRKTFELLEKNLPHKDASKPLKVLEIGIGSGANLRFYPENAHLTALDMNPNFESYFIEYRKKYSHIVHERTVIATAENMKGVDDSSMDVVISTYVLCSVTSINAVLKEVKRVLKPGGKFLFLEHVSHPKSDYAFTLQKFADPLWSTFFNGCHLLRNTGDCVKNAGFSDVICEKTFPPEFWLVARPQIYGIATK